MKLNQKGAFDLTLVAALVIVVAVGAFVLTRIGSENDSDTSTSEVAENTNEETEGDSDTIIEDQNNDQEISSTSFTVDPLTGGQDAGELSDNIEYSVIVPSDWQVTAGGSNSEFDGVTTQVGFVTVSAAQVSGLSIGTAIDSVNNARLYQENTFNNFITNEFSPVPEENLSVYEEVINDTSWYVISLDNGNGTTSLTYAASFESADNMALLSLTDSSSVGIDVLRSVLATIDLSKS